MVLGAIPVLIRVGIIAYRVVTAQNKAISKAWQGFNKDVISGVQWGAGLGALIGSTIDYYKQEESGGNIDGIPQTKVKQGNDNRFSKTRNKVFNPFGKRRYCKERPYSNRR